jgi:protein-S-isoprenylcysteine O-methyltransferase Ste14
MLSTQAQSTTAGVIARPPLLYLGALAVGLVVDHLWPLPFKISRPGLLMLLAGLALMVAGIRNFLRAKTPVPTVEPTRVLVTTGIHARSRNPIYLGMFLIYGGIAVLVRSPWALVFFVPLALAVRYGVVAREEAYLDQRFGDEYREYAARVRRWL